MAALVTMAIYAPKAIAAKLAFVPERSLLCVPQKIPAMRPVCVIRQRAFVLNQQKQMVPPVAMATPAPKPTPAKGAFAQEPIQWCAQRLRFASKRACAMWLPVSARRRGSPTAAPVATVIFVSVMRLAKAAFAPAAKG